MNKSFFRLAIATAMSMSNGAFALTDTELSAMMAEIQLECSTTATIDECNTLIQSKIAQLEADEAIDDSARVNALALIVETATSALNSGSATNTQIATEISEIVGSVSTQLSTIKSRSPETVSTINSAVSRVVIAVLVVIVEKDLQHDTTAAASVATALKQIADESSDNTQASAIYSIASIVETGGSILEATEEMDEVSSFASPA